MTWREGQPSELGRVVNEEFVNYDDAILAWKMQRGMADTLKLLAEQMAGQADERIESLRRNKLRAELTRCDYAAIPRATGSCKN